MLRRLKDALCARLINDYHKLLKLASVQFTLVLGVIGYLLTSFPDVFNSVIGQLPPDIRAMVPKGLIFAAVALQILARLWKQPKVTGGTNG